LDSRQNLFSGVRAVILTYAVILERVNLALDEAERLYADAPTPEHAALVKELRDPVIHLAKLAGAEIADAARGRAS
jgi:hypothetical protein